MPVYKLDGQAPEFPPEGQYYIAETAVLIGRVRLKSETSVWFGAVLRGDNEWIELGERSQIQDNATLHTDPGFPMTIGRDCVIGHNVILHGCTVGDNSLIGMGAIMLNGAKIGNNSLVGAGSVGQPRDGDWRAAYCIYHADENLIEQRRVRYDVERARKKIVAAGLPRLLADRLALGR
ncbi:MAG: DapH/DapD/GlmU-related protein [Pseudolabrys sp.]